MEEITGFELHLLTSSHSQMSSRSIGNEWMERGLGMCELVCDSREEQPGDGERLDTTNEEE